jgi:hypothetical protein
MRKLLIPALAPCYNDNEGRGEHPLPLAPIRPKLANSLSPSVPPLLVPTEHGQDHPDTGAFYALALPEGSRHTPCINAHQHDSGRRLPPG